MIIVYRDGKDKDFSTSGRFDSQIHCHMWVEFVGSLLCTERFSPGALVSPLLKNQRLTWFVLIVNFSIQCPQLVLQHWND